MGTDTDTAGAEGKVTAKQTVTVTLNRHELLAAAMGGCQRRILAVEKNRPNIKRVVDEKLAEWQIDIIGAIGEYAVAKALNMHWEPASDKKLKSLPGDVGRFQVRSTKYSTGKLIVHDGDADDAVFILAIVNEPDVTLMGWMYGDEARAIGTARQNYQQREWWVPQDRLRPIGELVGD